MPFSSVKAWLLACKSLSNRVLQIDTVLPHLGITSVETLWLTPAMCHPES